jgi:HD-GYP domain
MNSTEATSSNPAETNAKRPRALTLLSLAVVVVAIVGVSLIGVLVPRLVPAVPDARSTAAWVLLAIGLFLFAALAVRAANTFLLTRRIADFAVVVGLVLLACSLFGALALTYMDLGWWIGHVFELIGITLVGASVAYDLHRGSQSRPLVGDLRATEMVAAEEAFLGARVRALMVRLAEKDSSTEEHTRRVAALAIEVGERLGISATRLRDLAIGGLLHDVGKLSVRSRRRSCRSRDHSTTTSSTSSSCTRSGVRNSLRNSVASPTTSPTSSSTTTSASTAAAIRTASRATTSTSRPGSSPSATSTTRSSRPASTAPHGLLEGHSPYSKKRRERPSTPAVSRRS